MRFWCLNFEMVLLTFGGVDEVWRDEAAVKFHALNNFHLVVQGLAILR
jgi:hypothetical protein